MSGHIVYDFGAYRLDPADKSLIRDGAPVALTPKAFDTLAVLVESHPRLVTKDELLARVWPGTFVEDNNLAQYVSLLRRTLSDGAGADAVIETVPRRGYRFRLPVERIEVVSASSSGTAVARSADWLTPPALLTPPAGSDSTPSVQSADRRLRWPIVAAAAVLLVAGATTSSVFMSRGEPTSPVPVTTAARDPQAHLAYLSGRAAFAQGYSDTVNQARARADLERSVALDPGFAPAWALLAQVYGARYRTAMDRDPALLDAAERAASTAVSLDPRLPAGHLALADVHYSRRDNDKARAALDAGHDVLTGDATYWHLRSFLAKREGRWRDSEAALATAFDLDAPATAEWMAVHYLQLRQYADARRVLAVANASSRTAAVVPDAWTRFSEHGDLAAARPVLEAALGARTPPDARVLSLLAQLEWFDGRADRALELIDRMDPAGAWLAPNFRFPAAIAAGDVLDGLGRHAEARARYADAVAALEMRRQADPDDEKIAAGLGLAYAGLGRTDEALRHARRAVMLLPRERDAGEGPLYLYLLARVHARVGQLAEATAVLDSMFDAPGFYSDAWVARDPSFARLRTEEAYAAHVDRWTRQRGDVLLAGAVESPHRVTAAATLGQ